MRYILEAKYDSNNPLRSPTPTAAGPTVAIEAAAVLDTDPEADVAEDLTLSLAEEAAELADAMTLLKDAAMLLVADP